MPNNTNNTDQKVKKTPDKMLRFATEYLVDHNATQAAIRAGYSNKSAHVQGSKMLKDPRVKAIVDQGTKAIMEQCRITGRGIIEEIAHIALANAKDYMSWGPEGVTLFSSDDLTRGQAAAIAEVLETQTVSPRGEVTIQTKIKFHPKLTALTQLKEILGLDQHNLPPGITVNIQAQDGSKVAIQVNEVLKDYAEALRGAVAIVKEIPPKELTKKAK